MIVINRTAFLNKMNDTEILKGQAFTSEDCGHRFVITCRADGANVDLTGGTVTGRFLRADGVGVQLTPSYAGITEDGKAWVELPANCYTVRGQFVLVIFYIDGDGHKCAIYSASGYVRPGEAGTIVAPEEIIDVDAIQALISDMQDAIDDCGDAAALAQEAASFVNTTIAPTYSSTVTYAVGDYVTKDGTMYRCIVDIDEGETWTAAHWTQVTAGGELSAQKIAAQNTANVNYKNTMSLVSGQRNMFDYTSAGCTQYQYIGADGTIHTGSSSAFANYWTSHPITVGKGTYKFTAYPSEFGSSAGIVGVFDLDGNMTGTLAATVENGVATLVVDNVCRVCFNSHKSIIAQAVFCEASLWDGTYHPYDMAISGNVLDLNVDKDDTDFFLRTQGTNLLDLRGRIAGKYFNVAPNQRYTGMLSNLNGVSAYYVRLNGAGNYITKVDRGNFGSNAKYLSLYDKNKRYLTTVTGNLDTSGASHASECTFEITAAHISAGAVYLGLTVHDGQVGNVMVVKSTTYPASFIPYAEKWTIPDITVEASQLGDMTGEIGKEETDFFAEVKSDNLLDLSDPADNKYFSVNNGALTDIASSYNVESVYVKLDGAGTYVTKADYDLYGSNAAKVCLFNSAKTYVATVTGTLGSTSDGKRVPLSFTVTDAHILAGAVYVGITLYKPNANTLMIVKDDTYPGTYEPYFDEWTIPALTVKAGQAPTYTPNPLYRKIAVFDGDSICAAGTDTSGKGAYAGRIAAANGMTHFNYAVGGGTITDGITGHYCISGNVDTIYASHPDADYVIFEGGTNDADLIGRIVDDSGQPITPPTAFGSFSPADFSGSYDSATFCGAVETMLYKALSHWPHAKIGYVCGPKMRETRASNTTMLNRMAYWKTAIEICRKWGVPYINLCEKWHSHPMMTMYYDSTMTTAENREAGHFYGDGQHPTPTGYDDMSGIIEAWMRTL